MISIVDTHCHLDLNQFDEDRTEVLERALKAGVHAMVLVGYNPERWLSTQRLCDQYPYLTRTVGVHPNDAGIWTDAVRREMRAEIERNRPVAIGEIGMDFYRSADDASQQRTAFAEQLEIAAEFNLPVVIHQRAAEDAVLDVLSEIRPASGVMHCFTGNRDYAQRCLQLGLTLGVGGVITFPKSNEIRDALQDVPLESIVLETDAPFLAPQVRRGKRNESSLLPAVLLELAQLNELSESIVAQQTTQTAIKLFGTCLSHAITLGLDAA